jgi:hypothetical protein
VYPHGDGKAEHEVEMGGLEWRHKIEQVIFALIVHQIYASKTESSVGGVFSGCAMNEIFVEINAENVKRPREGGREVPMEALRQILKVLVNILG